MMDTVERNKLVEDNIGLIYRVCKDYNISCKEDLIQEGVLGLIKAIDMYIPEKGSLSTYMYIWVKKFIFNYLYRDEPISLSYNITLLRARYYKEKYTRLRSNQSLPTKEEFCSILGCSESVLNNIEDTFNIVYLDEKTNINSEDSLTYLDTIVSDFDIDSNLERGYKRKTILDALKTLKPVYKKVILLRFGLDGEDPKTYEEIGVLLGLSRQRINKIEKTALYKLRHNKTLVEYMKEA